MSIYDYKPILIYCTVLAFCFGCCMGSFLNCAAWRIVHGESFLKGRSHCPVCNHALGFVELIPVLGWILLGGKCKHCGSKISVRYLITELCFGIITALCLLRFDLTPLCLRNFGFLCILFLLTLTDIEAMIIPDGCHIAAIIIWILAEPFVFSGWKDLANHVLAMFVFGGGLLIVSLIMDKIMGRDSLGGGDIKLFGVIGLYLGMVGTLFTMMIACIAGLIYHLLRRNSEEEKAFPFGPWIAGAAAFMLLYGDPLVNWYMGLLK